MLVESACLPIAFIDPQVQGGAGPTGLAPRCRRDEQLTSEAASPGASGDVQVIEEGPPSGVGIEEGAHKSTELRVLFREQHQLRVGGVGKPRGPERQAIRIRVAIKVSIGQDSSVGRAPARGVQARDAQRICRSGLSNAQDQASKNPIFTPASWITSLSLRRVACAPIGVPFSSG
jgi:hypothetical protein